MENEQKSENSIEDNGFQMNDDKNAMPAIVEHILMQYSLKQGIAKYGKRAEKATEKELSQIHNMDALKPLDANSLTAKKRKMPLHH